MAKMMDTSAWLVGVNGHAGSTLRSAAALGRERDLRGEGARGGRDGGKGFGGFWASPWHREEEGDGLGGSAAAGMLATAASCLLWRRGEDDKGRASGLGRSG